MYKSILSKVVRAHLCTLAIALSLNSWWRVPLAGFRYGGVAFGLALTVAAITVAAPAALLQLALGQLCQRGVVGIWRAIPFFTGVGYLRLLITSLSSVYTVLHLALVTTNLFYTLSNQGSFGECAELIIPEDLSEASVINSSLICYTESLMAPAGEEPGYYTAVALLIASFWILLPFLLYSPVKFMKRIFYLLGPLVLLLGTVIVANIGVWADLLTIQKRSDWPNYLDPDIWHAAVIQGLCSAQVAGGFLVSTGDVLYSSTDIQRTTVIVIATNVVTSWLGLLFWFAVGGSMDKDTSLVAVIYQVYFMADEKRLGKIWPLLIFLTLGLSGIITVVTTMYPLYERFRMTGGVRWRALTGGSSLVGGVVTLAVLAGKLPALHLLEDVALPLLISITTVLEIAVFLFIYGWKVLVDDVEFLTEKPLSKCWVMGWCVAPGIVAPFSAWWVVTVALQSAGWRDPPYSAAALLASSCVALLVLLACAAVAVSKQVQYDFLAKLKSSFRPSRHWGPRDPIMHYYWVSRHMDSEREAAGSRQEQDSRQPAVISTTCSPPRRGHSDDWFYTVYRRQFLNESGLGLCTKRKRCKSLDCELIKDNDNHSFHDVIKDLHSYSKNVNTMNTVVI